MTDASGKRRHELYVRRVDDQDVKWTFPTPDPIGGSFPLHKPYLLAMKAQSFLGASALSLLSLACGGLFKVSSPATQGANPLTSGATLTAAQVPLNYPAYTCKPRREPVEYKLSATPEQVCVDFKGGVMRQVGEGAPTAEPMPVILRIDGKASPGFNLVPQGMPSPLNDCTASQNPPYREWVVQARGCTPNGGLLAAQSRSAELLSEDGATYASFSFGNGEPAAAE